MLAYPKYRYGFLPSPQGRGEPAGSSGGRHGRAGGKAPPPTPRRPPALHANRGQMDAIASAGLKRKFEDADVGSPGSNSDDEISNSDSADSCDSVNPSSSTGFIREWSGTVPVRVPSLRVPLPSSTWMWGWLRFSPLHPL